jgi:predicted regulator of Ras-like GTPase activity (Roadblock/LC7/MglB family)
MGEDVYALTLKTALTEIRIFYPDITRSFIFAKDGTIIAEAEQDAEKPLEKKINSFQRLIEKADTISGMDTFLVNGDKGVFQVSQISSMYLVLAASKKADIANIGSVAKIAIQTVMKILENIVSTPTQPASPSQNLTAENLNGVFAGETAQVDDEVLEIWSKNSDDDHIEEIEIKAPNGKTARCKVKPITEQEFEGKSLIRIPEKIYHALKVEKGEQVKVKPVLAGRK